MNFAKLDMFSTEFTFNLGNLNSKKGTFLGTLLTIFVVFTALTYLTYILQQYFHNLIDPNYRSQNVISSQLIDVELNNDFLGFRFEYDLNKGIESLQKQKNLTYVVYIAQFQISNGVNQQTIQLDIIECQNESLQGFNCVDFSKLQNSTLFNYKQQSQYSSIQIYIYGCLDLDDVKTTIPDNCAPQVEIDQIINGYYAGQRLMLSSSLYDVTSKKFLISYRNIFVYAIGNQYVYTTVETQKQSTTIKQGLFIQSEQTFSSPIQYGINNQNFDKQYSIQTCGIGPYNQFNIVIDEIVQQIKIEYQTIPQVLAMVNSTFTLLMFLGVIGRYLAKRSIMQDLFMLFLRNMYQDSYSQLLKLNSFFQSNQEFEFNLDLMQKKNKFVEEKDESQSINFPSLTLKTKQNLDIKRLTSINYENINSSQIGDSDKIINQNQSLKFFSKMSSVTYEQKENMLEDRQANISSFYKQSTKDNQQKIDQSICSDCSPNQMLNKQIKRVVTNQLRLKKTSSIKNISQTTDNPLYNQANKQNNNDQNKSVFDYYSEKLKAIYNFSISQKMQNIIFKTRFCKRKKDLSRLGLSHQMKKTISEEVNKNIDIFQVYKDILFLKKAVLILLTKEQLAALQLVGCSTIYLNQKDNSQQEQTQTQFGESRKLNYFEQQMQILQSQELQSRYIKKFIAKFHYKQDFDLTDERILSSISKCNDIE
ncbi:AMP-binding enzyme family protein (macronuclear) [Tetrahymena thermophila SB210]|uniref:AMP-binding enzyme family protein n=1 Tax=Tetrahymena thermophila (strain SB210) TaxID=312017 RepID=W7XKV6_TETTS|nr:AMP-binding enzyme family protein [Tetrahymena thermophila SB210]EWS75264.1 AMP-binding enzyme family protein [Tetrahymena thermophila SB210]|eukprot:XP_012652255.1 AMP-binding enzyme family protein [Tetrahymena thermophila SB210]